MPGHPHRPGPAHRQQGFSLVELAVVLGIFGVLAMTMTSAFDSVAQAREHNAARAHAESARQALRHFALRNKRLPCPDTSRHGDAGREADGGACSSAMNSGWLPYESLGQETPPRARRLRYGVYRGSVESDLVAPQPTSADAPDLEGSGGFLSALSRGAGRTASTGQPHHAAAAIQADCGSEITNPAFVLVAPVADRDGRGDDHPGFDGVHAAFAAGSSRCVASPGYPGDATFDDIVVSESHTTLLGWMSTVTR